MIFSFALYREVYVCLIISLFIVLFSVRPNFCYDSIRLKRYEVV